MASEYSLESHPSFSGQNIRKIGAKGHHKAGMRSAYLPSLWSSKSRRVSRHRSTSSFVGISAISKFPPLFEQKAKERVYSYAFQKQNYWPNDIESLIRRAVSDNYAKNTIANVIQREIPRYNMSQFREKGLGITVIQTDYKIKQEVAKTAFTPMEKAVGKIIGQEYSHFQKAQVSMPKYAKTAAWIKTGIKAISKIVDKLPIENYYGATKAKTLQKADVSFTAIKMPVAKALYEDNYMNKIMPQKEEIKMEIKIGSSHIPNSPISTSFARSPRAYSDNQDSKRAPIHQAPKAA